jgi:hypothetical protein
VYYNLYGCFYYLVSGWFFGILESVLCGIVPFSCLFFRFSCFGLMWYCSFQLPVLLVFMFWSYVVLFLSVACLVFMFWSCWLGVDSAPLFLSCGLLSLSIQFWWLVCSGIIFRSVCKGELYLLLYFAFREQERLTSDITIVLWLELLHTCIRYCPSSLATYRAQCFGGWIYYLLQVKRRKEEPRVDSASDRNEYQEYFLKVKAAGWGTALQTGRSRFWVPMVSLEFFLT